jgi:hypothetical protein
MLLGSGCFCFPHLRNRVLSALTLMDAANLRGVSRRTCQAVADHQWRDSKTRIRGSLQLWRRSFPNAASANISERVDLADADFVYLRGIHTLNMEGCGQSIITDAAFAYLRGIHTLDMSFCD